MDSRTHHHMGVRELDLSACHVNSLSDKINAVPGLRTSTGESLIPRLTSSYLFIPSKDGTDSSWRILESNFIEPLVLSSSVVSRLSPQEPNIHIPSYYDTLSPSLT